MADLMKSFRKRASKAYIQSRIARAFGIKPLLEPTHFSIPNIDWGAARAAHDKQILYVTPMYGPDATSLYADFVLAEFRRRGYTVHAIVYDNTDRRPQSKQWDHVYNLESQSGRFGKTRDDGCGSSHDDIDDWAGDDLALFAASLAAAVPFEICICNYVFMSRVFEVQCPSTHKILLTIDVFAGRNAKILKTYGNDTGFFFSTSKKGECKGLSRADTIVAIQAEEGEYFSALCPDTDVTVLPMVPEPRYFDQDPSSPIRVGYIASEHRPNVDAIERFIRELKPESGVSLGIAGSICRALRKLELPSHVQLEGRVEDLGVFYERCDLIINPDMLKSGLKVKCVEALSYGRPLVCTAAASTGIGLEADYHNAGSTAEVAEWVSKAVRDPAILVEMASESRRKFDAFRQSYSVERFADDMISKAAARD